MTGLIQFTQGKNYFTLSCRARLLLAAGVEISGGGGSRAECNDFRKGLNAPGIGRKLPIMGCKRKETK